METRQRRSLVCVLSGRTFWYHGQKEQDEDDAQHKALGLGWVVQMNGRLVNLYVCVGVTSDLPQETAERHV